MKVAALFTAGMIVLFLIGLESGRRVFPQLAHNLGHSETSAQADGDATAARMADYKRMKLAFISFDLFNGLSKKDIEDIPEKRSLAFHVVMIGLVAVVFLRHLKPRKSP